MLDVGALKLLRSTFIQCAMYWLNICNNMDQSDSTRMRRCVFKFHWLQSVAYLHVLQDVQVNKLESQQYVCLPFMSNTMNTLVMFWMSFHSVI